MPKPLTGKVALVTGGSRGIGAAIVRRLAGDGADVAFSYAASPAKADHLAKDIVAAGGKAAAYRADSADAQQVKDLVNTVHGKSGRLDILVNSAGVSLMGSIADPSVDHEAMTHQFAINVTAVATAVRTAVPLLVDGGRIVTIGTVFASQTPLPGWGDYAASKAAVAAYTRAWARDLGPRRIKINVLQPGPIHTDGNPDDSEHAPTLAKMTALGRYGRVSEIAAVVAFLVGPDASYVTGETLNVDGGMLA